MKLLVVGCGFSGAVLSRELVSRTNAEVHIIDKSSHIAGNCHTERDKETGVMIHQYGPHIFHTSNKKIWDYIRQFGEFSPFVNRIKADTGMQILSLPINLHTINQFFGKRFNPQDANDYIASLGDNSIGTPENFEEQALKVLGKELYQAIFYGYTKKQWGCEPAELPASILKRLPVRFSYDDNYYFDSYQGIPIEGYTSVINNILDHPRISVSLNTSWNPGMSDHYDHVFYTGPIDEYYNYLLGPLGYRSVYWEREVHKGDFQGNCIINYTDENIPYTRVIEHKHFTPWEDHELTTVNFEYSKETGIDDVPFYPKRLESDKVLLRLYIEAAHKDKKVSFLGRLGTYRYIDMHIAIEEAIDFGERASNSIVHNKPIPVFGVRPL